MKRYVYHQGAVMLHIDEGDPVPSMADIDEADRLQLAIAAGDPRVVLTPWPERPELELAAWQQETGGAA